MTDRESLLAAILADPLSDEPRLQFADWIREQGDGARADFIEAQVELARMSIWKSVGVGRIEVIDQPGHGFEGKVLVKDERYIDLRRRESKLLNGRSGESQILNGAKWLGGDDETAYRMYGQLRPVYRRGFVDELRADAATILDGRELVMPPAHSESDEPVEVERVGIARSLIWWPGATDVCPCKGKGYYWSKEDAAKKAAGSTIQRRPCRRCRDTKGKPSGRIPRPLPEPAQPVRRVVLTSMPNADQFAPFELWMQSDQGGPPSLCWKTTLEKKFGPHVEWVLPTEADT